MVKNQKDLVAYKALLERCIKAKLDFHLDNSEHKTNFFKAAMISPAHKLVGDLGIQIVLDIYNIILKIEEQKCGGQH